MGSSSSKPLAEATRDEKTGAQGQPSPRRQEIGAHQASTHHAADRLLRIAAEATASHNDQTSSIPEHENTHAEVKMEALKAWDAVALKDPTSQLAAMTIHNTIIRDSIRRRTAETADQHVFSHTLPSEGTPVVNQLSSGRCWLFATTNVIRLQVIKQLNLKEFELSQSYLSFWDKLEKSNTFLENSIELADAPLDDRVFGFLKTAPTNDGGQWDMVTNLIKKYGLVPKSIYPESYNSSNSSQLNWLITLKLREYALELRLLKKATINALQKAGSMDDANIERHTLKVVRSRKDTQMAEVYRMMVIALGVPPKADEEFTFEYYDCHDKFHAIKTTPKGFLDKYTGSFDPAGACSLVNDPRRSYSKLITVDRLQNVWGGQPVLYVNTSMSQMKTCVVASIKAGLPVFFGCDVGQFSARTGVMDTQLYDYELAFGIKLGLTKAERLELGESSMTHAMVITGVHLDQKGEPVRYRVENSWGKEAGEKGYMVMTDAWFDQFVYQVVIRKQQMPAKLWGLFEAGINEETDVLPPYDPMGALASSSAMEVDAVPSSKVAGVEAGDEEGEEEQAQDSTSDIPDDEYEIEAILSHEVGHFAKHEIAYLVSWKGYGPEHNSWVRDGDAENAPDMISEYWATANKEGVVMKANGKGWTGAKSSKRAMKKEYPSDAVVHRGGRRSALAISSPQEERLAKKRARVASQASYSRAGVELVDGGSVDDEGEVSERQRKKMDGDEHEKVAATRRYLRMADWEHVVRHVETVERLDNGKLIAFLIFDNGERYAYEAAVANHRCPQKVISFYESRLRFKPNPAKLPPLSKALTNASQQAVQEGEQSSTLQEGGEEGEAGQGEQEAAATSQAESTAAHPTQAGEEGSGEEVLDGERVESMPEGAGDGEEGEEGDSEEEA